MSPSPAYGIVTHLPRFQVVNLGSDSCLLLISNNPVSLLPHVGSTFLQSSTGSRSILRTRQAGKRPFRSQDIVKNIKAIRENISQDQ